MSLKAPDSPNRSCQELASTIKRHEQFADALIPLEYFYSFFRPITVSYTTIAVLCILITDSTSLRYFLCC